MIAQVRAGLWVRNGFGHRAQHLHYRDAHLRENTFDQDLFFLQCLACAVDDPSRLLVTLVDRFGLATWFVKESERPFELGQIVSLLEELLWLITVTVSEPSNVAGWPAGDRLLREVVHVLCLGPLPFTEIEKRVPGRLTEIEGSLDKVLKEVADFKLPAGTSDVGTFTLRPDYLADVDPFFYRFSRNQREECDKLATAQLRKSTGDPTAVRVPRRTPVKDGPFAGLTRVFTTKALVQILFVCLARFHPHTKAYSENLADHAVHLVMLGLLEGGRQFAELATTSRFTLGSASSGQLHHMTLSGILQAMEREAAMKPLKPKVSWCLDQIRTSLNMPRPAPAASTGDNKAAGAEDAKKAAAKARQAAIMKQMAEQQQQAMQNLAFEDDDEEDEDEAMEGDQDPVVSHGQCIVCQDELHDGDDFGSLCYLQTSRFVRQTPIGVPPERATEWLGEALEAPENLDFDCRLDGPFGVAGKRTPETDEVADDSTPFAFPHHHVRGVYASACGHLMHLSCFHVYYASVKQRHLTQVTRNHPENIERYEFLCPLCRSLGNVLLPHVKTARVSALEPQPADIRAWLTSQPSAAALAHGDTVQFAMTESTMEQWVFDELLPMQKGSAAAASSGVPKASATMLARFATVSQVLGSELQTLRDDYDGDSVAPRRRQSVDADIIAYTIACIEIASRGTLQQDGVASSVTDGQRRLLQALFGSLKAILCMAAVSPLGPERAAAMLAQQFYVNESDMAARRPHMLTDPLALLVQIASVSPEAVPHAICVCYYLEVLRAAFGLARFGAEYGHEWWRQARVPPASGAENVSDGQLWRSLIIRFFTIFSNPWQNALASMDDLSFQRLLFAYTLPFLRRAAIVQHIVTGGARDLVRSLPQALEDANEHERLRFQLGIPPVSEVFAQTTDGSNDPLCTLMMRWLNHFHRYARGQGPPSSIYKTLPALEHPGIYELVGLPRSYNALVSEGGTRKCPRCNMIPTKPALCLLCGAIVCTQSYCCMIDNIANNPEHGECNMHMWRCAFSLSSVAPCRGPADARLDVQLRRLGRCLPVNYRMRLDLPRDPERRSHRRPIPRRPRRDQPGAQVRRLPQALVHSNSDASA